MRYIISILFTTITITVFNACSGNNSLKISEVTDEIKVYNFSRSYEGAINNKYEIIMKLSRSGKDLSGSYSYKINDVSIKISGTIDKSGVLIINEYNENGILTGIFKGTLLEGNISGNWSKADGSSVMPFTLKEFNISELENNQLERAKINWEGNYTFTGDYSTKELTISKLNSKGEFEFEFMVSSESCIAYSYLGTARLTNNTYATGTAEDNFGKSKITLNYNISKKIIEVSSNSGGRCLPDGAYKVALK